MRLGVEIKNNSPMADSGMLDLARQAEAGGADSLWLSDHLLRVDGDTSRYPFSPDGRTSAPSELPMYEALITLAAIGAVTNTIRLGTSVLVLAQRHPLELAKQAATIDRLSGGRLDLGVGPGWNVSEMEALGWQFESRGPRTDEMIEVLRAAWATGIPGPYSGKHFQIDAGVRMFPMPEAPIPLLVGGINPTAIRRAARLGDGWVGIAFAERYNRDDIVGQLAMLNGLVGKRAFRRIVSLHGAPTWSGSFPHIVAELMALGIDEVIVEIPWSSGVGEALACLDACKQAALAA
jgi:probable F420-dependent oxidoreductase